MTRRSFNRNEVQRITLRSSLPQRLAPLNDNFKPHEMIRDAEREDLKAIVAIYNASIPGRLATADTDPVTVQDRTSWFDRHDPARRPLKVLEAGSEIRGWVSFEPFYGRPAYDHTAEISVYVAPAFQGRGIGARLLQHAITIAPELGLVKLVGFIFAHNEPSLRLFRQFGFEHWGLLPGIAVLDGEKRDLAIMGRDVERGHEGG